MYLDYLCSPNTIIIGKTMMTIDQIKELMNDLESDRIERTISFKEEKLAQAVCAFSNDFPHHKAPGYILLGVNDDGKPAGITRVGPRRSQATVAEENILTERRASYAKTYDLVPALGSTLEDLSLEHFKLVYLPLAIDAETLRINGRSTIQQLSALRFYDLANACPTYAGILMFGLNPLFYLPGAYLQYIRFNGPEVTDGVAYEKQFSGPLVTELRVIDDFIRSNIIKERPVRTESSFEERTLRNYSYWAIRELMMNAIMHRNYEANAPIYIYEFTNRIEIVNSGGLYGDVTITNFPYASDYRNVVLAEAMKIMGYVNRFNYGVQNAIAELRKNGNSDPQFDLSLGTKFKVTISIHKEW